MGVAGMHTTLLRTYADAETGPGANVRVPLDLLAPMRGDRDLHIKEIKISGSVNLTKNAVAMGGACPGVLLKTALQNIKFRVAGHAFIDSINGADVALCSAIRRGVDDYGDDDLAAVDITEDVDFVLRIPLGRPAAGDKKRTDGYIACANFIGSGREQNGLTFNVAAALGVDGPTGAFPGVTVNGLTDVKVHVTVVPGDRRQVQTDWQWGRYTTVQGTFLSIPARRLGGIEAIVMRCLPNGVPNHDLTDCKLIQDGETIWDSLTSSERAAASHTERDDFPPEANIDQPEFVPFVMMGVDDKRSMYLRAAEIRLEYKDSGGNTRFDVLVMSTGRLTESMLNKFGLAAGAPADPSDANSLSSEVFVRTRSANGGPAKNTAPILDRELVWPTMSSRIGRSAYMRSYEREKNAKL